MPKFIVYVPRITYDKFLVTANHPDTAMDLASSGKIAELEFDCHEMTDWVLENPVLCYDEKEKKILCTMDHDF